MGWPTGTGAWRTPKGGTMGDGFGGGRKAGPKGGTPASACRMGPVCKTGTGAALEASRCTATSCATCNFSCRMQQLLAKCSAEPCTLRMSIWCRLLGSTRQDALCDLWYRSHGRHFSSTPYLLSSVCHQQNFACSCMLQVRRHLGFRPRHDQLWKTSPGQSLIWACQMLWCMCHS